MIFEKTGSEKKSFSHFSLRRMSLRFVFKPRRGSCKDIFFSYSYLLSTITAVVMLICLLCFVFFDNFNDIGTIAATYPYYIVDAVLVVFAFIAIFLITLAVFRSNRSLTISIYVFNGICVFLSCAAIVFFICLYFPFKTVCTSIHPVLSSFSRTTMRAHWSLESSLTLKILLRTMQSCGWISKTLMCVVVLAMFFCSSREQSASSTL